MSIDLSVITQALRQLWSDTMDITGYTDSEDSDGSTNPANPMPKAVSVQCRLSFKHLDSPASKEYDRQPIKVIPRLSCDVNIPVKKGDLVKVSRRNCAGMVLKEYEGVAGLPAVYQSHQEFEIQIEGQA